MYVCMSVEYSDSSSATPSALGVLNVYALYKSTHSLTYSYT